METITQSARETEKLGEKIGADLKPGTVLALFGELGSGKTTFLKGLAEGLGIKERIISPTFVFQRQYPLEKGQGVFYHFDLYRIEGANEAKGLGLEEALSDPESISAIEWAEKIKEILPQKRKEVYFEYLGENKRRIVYETLS